MTTAASGFFTGQVGAKIRLETSDDAALLALATVKRILYRRPVSGTLGYWTATIEDSTKLAFTTTAVGDLPEAGEYRLQAYIEAPGFKITGSIAVMLVEQPISPIT